jgi:putative membrane protein
MQEVMSSLKEVAVKCLEKAISLKQLPFEVGAASVFPKEFRLEDGMGAGGITVVAVNVGAQKTAYVVIDGNNMVSGLREKILAALREIGFDDGEIFTTDTHSVNAIVLNARGYSPVGESIDHQKLVDHIKQAALTAVSNLESVKVACRSIMVQNVKVIGEKQLETLCLLIDRGLKRAKHIVVPIFAASGLLLMLLLLFV